MNCRCTFAAGERNLCRNCSQIEDTSYFWRPKAWHKISIFSPCILCQSSQSAWRSAYRLVLWFSFSTCLAALHDSFCSLNIMACVAGVQCLYVASRRHFPTGFQFSRRFFICWKKNWRFRWVFENNSRTVPLQFRFNAIIDAIFPISSFNGTGHSDAKEWLSETALRRLITTLLFSHCLGVFFYAKYIFNIPWYLLKSFFSVPKLFEWANLQKILLLVLQEQPFVPQSSGMSSWNDKKSQQKLFDIK